MLVSFVEDIALLLKRHIRWVFVRVAMETNFMTCVTDCRTVFGKGVERMTRLQASGNITQMKR